MLKRFIIFGLLLVLVVGGIAGVKFWSINKMIQQYASMPVPTTTVSTATVEAVTWKPGIEAIGTVNAAQGVDLAVETTGIVSRVLFAANQKVSSGALLVELDSTKEEADLAAARTQSAVDQDALNRAVELRQRGVSTEVSVDTARAVASASAAQLVRLEATVDQKKVRAPFAGTMGIPKVEPGQYLAPGTIVATLQDLEIMRTDFAIPEQQLPLLKMGYKVALGIGQEDMPFTGTVIGIDPKVDPLSRLVAVRAKIGNPGGQLTPGQFVQIRVELPDEPGVLAIPQTALVSSLYGDYVFVIRPAPPPAAAPQSDGPAEAAPAPAPVEAAPAPAAEAGPPPLIAVQVFVTAGRRNAGLVEITKGLNAGDEVVAAGQNRLTNNGRVVIEGAEEPAPDGAGAAPRP